MMPGLTGAALARRVRTLHPALPVLLVTGYASLTDDESSSLEVLAKPFRMADLAARIAQLTAPEC
jgi:CheY-like chemotaxis protein